MKLESLTRSPRTNYQQLRDAAIIKHDPRNRWELKSKDAHTRSEKQRLANQAFEARFRDLLG